mmetsp:Transcript_39186/g.87221  ORF Transcript_39186/g.87221 Transcript_39186/m.87221 type:complete len:128 (-) Transcript_39186:426-809(-)
MLSTQPSICVVRWARMREWAAICKSGMVSPHRTLCTSTQATASMHAQQTPTPPALLHHQHRINCIYFKQPVFLIQSYTQTAHLKTGVMACTQVGYPSQAKASKPTSWHPKAMHQSSHRMDPRPAKPN